MGAMRLPMSFTKKLQQLRRHCNIRWSSEAVCSRSVSARKRATTRKFARPFFFSRRYPTHSQVTKLFVPPLPASSQSHPHNPAHCRRPISQYINKPPPKLSPPIAAPQDTMTPHSRLPPADPALENEQLVAQLKLARDEIDRLKAHNNNLIQCLLESERAFARLKALNEKGSKRKREDLPSPFEQGPDADESASKTEEGYRPKFFENLVCGLSKPQEEKEEEEKPRKKARTRRNRPAR